MKIYSTIFLTIGLCVSQVQGAETVTTLLHCAQNDGQDTPVFVKRIQEPESKKDILRIEVFARPSSGFELYTSKDYLISHVSDDLLVLRWRAGREYEDSSYSIKRTTEKEVRKLLEDRGVESHLDFDCKNRGEAAKRWNRIDLSCNYLDVEERNGSLDIHYDSPAPSGYGGHHVGSFQIVAKTEEAIYLDNAKLQGKYKSLIPQGFAYKTAGSLFKCEDLNKILD